MTAMSTLLFQDVELLIASFPQLTALLQAHNSDPSQLLKPYENLKKTAESYRTLLKSRDRDRIHQQLQRFFPRPERDVFDLLPAVSEVNEELLPILEPLRTEMPFHTTNLSLS